MLCEDRRIGYMFLGEVALGREHHITADQPSLKQPPPGFDSVIARGRTEPGEPEASEAEQAWEGEGAPRSGPGVLSGGGSREGAGEKQASSLQPFPLSSNKSSLGIQEGFKEEVSLTEHQKVALASG